MKSRGDNRRERIDRNVTEAVYTFRIDKIPITSRNVSDYLTDRGSTTRYSSNMIVTSLKRLVRTGLLRNMGYQNQNYIRETNGKIESAKVLHFELIK